MMDKKLVVGLLLVASVATAQVPAQSLSAAMEAAVVGSVIDLPQVRPEGWELYAVVLGQQTPGWDRWGDGLLGRVLLAYHGQQYQRVLAVQIKGDELWFWAAGELEGEGWSVSDRLPEPTPVVPVLPAMDETLLAQVDKAQVGEVIALPATKPGGWREIQLRLIDATAAWVAGQVGALVCEADGTRVSFVIASVGDGSAATAKAWMRDSDVALLTNRQWRQVTLKSAPAAPASTPLSEKPKPAPSLLDTPGLVMPETSTATRPVSKPAAPPSAAQTTKPWVADVSMIDRLPLGSSVDVGGIDPYATPMGWNSGIVANPAPEWQPGVVIAAAEGRAVVVVRREAETDRQRTTALYWYRLGSGQTALETLPSPTDISRLAVGARVALPAGADFMRPPAGWFKSGFSPLTDQQRRLLPPGTVIELFSDGRVVKAVVVSTVYDPAKPEEWTACLWAAVRPDAKIEWELRLPLAR